MNGKFASPNFGEPLYREWATLTDDLLSRLKKELTQSLSSVLNAPDQIQVEEPETTLERLLTQGYDEDEEEALQKQLHGFYGPSRAAFRLFYQLSASEEAANDESEEIPPEFCAASFRPVFGDEALSPLFLQKLSHLLDAAELGLVRETARRASAFFQALTQLRDLHLSVARAVATIRAARSSAAAVQTAVAQPGIALAVLQRRRHNIGQAEACMRRLATRIQHEARVDALIEEGHLLEALELDESSSESKMFLGLREAGFDKADRIELRAKAALVQEIVGGDGPSEDRESRLAALLNVLARSGKLSDGTRVLREKCISCVEAGGTQENAIELLDRSFVLLERVRVAEEMLSALNGGESRDEEDLLQSVVDSVDVQMSKKLRFRTDEMLRLRLDVFAETFHKLNAFEARWLSGGRELKIVLNSLARQYLEQFHRNQCLNLTAVLDGERWVPVTVPAEFQTIVNRLSAVKAGEASETPGEELLVGDEAFRPVAATLSCVQTVGLYMQCAEALPGAACEAASLMCKMIKLFNSKSALQILGAEATRGPAQLKAISAKHLALCSESVAAIRALIRLIAGKLEEEVRKSARLEEAEEEMLQHERDVENKLVSIMRELAASMRDSVAAAGGGSVSLSVLADRTQNLFRILEKVLPKQKLARLFDLIHAVYVDMFPPSTPSFDRIETLRSNCLKNEHENV